MGKMEIVLLFQLQKDFISKNWCINRFEPVTTCAGKCYLTKKLTEQDQQENQQLPASGKQFSAAPGIEPPQSDPPVLVFQVNALRLGFVHNNAFLPSAYPAPILQPPQFA